MILRDKNLYFVGGAVRDELLGVSSPDIDYCYEGNAIEFAKKSNLEILQENPDFGTVRVLYNGKQVDIASTREEYYPKKGGLPKVRNIGCPLIEDLKRRDFTVNTLAKNTVTGEIIDFFGGIKDIKSKTLKVLHDESFIDDPTRIVRALKFSVRFGFKKDDITKTLQENYLKNINYDMSYHRLKKEIKETFNLNIYSAYEIFKKEEIYKLLSDKTEIPNLSEDISGLISKYKIENPWIVYMCGFNLKNFELSSKEAEILKSFSTIKTVQPKDDYEIYSLFKGLPIESVLLYYGLVNKNPARRFLDELSQISPKIKGEDLASLGIKQGKIYKEIFEYILKEKLKTPNINKEDEIELVKRKYID